MLNERHLQRLILENFNYHHEDRIHKSFLKGNADRRGVEKEDFAERESDLQCAGRWSSHSVSWNVTA